ncbi:MAG: hypothetical protein EZS28_013774, partial [Streblomastix strix]
METNIEKGEQYGDAMTALSASQSTALTAYAKALQEKPNADECKHIFKLSTIGANAVTQLREGINLPYQFRIVAGNNVLPPDIITDETIERIKRYTEQKNLEYQAAAMAMKYGTQFLPQLFTPSAIPFVAPPQPYDQMQQYSNQQPGGFPRRGREFQSMWRGGRGRGRGGSKQTSKLALTHSQCFHAILEPNQKRCKAHPHHRANKKKRKKGRMIVMSWGEDYKG